MTTSPQQRRLERLANEGIQQRSVLVHKDNEKAFNELRPTFADPSMRSDLEAFACTVARGKPINVAQVKQLSPFRYPGGKTWLVPVVREWFQTMETRPELLVESFAGGAVVGLTAAAEQWVDHVLLVEKDDEISAVWSLVIHGPDDEFEKLLTAIADYEFTTENVRNTIDSRPRLAHRRALRTLVKNRGNRGGIMAPGAGLMKNGEGGKGIASRWYPETLIKRLSVIRSIRDRLTFQQGDALDAIKDHRNAQTAHFIDPPYTAGGKKAGRRLYTYNAVDHDLLFEITARIQGPAMLTYDDNEWVRDKASEMGFEFATSTMQSTHLVTMHELVVLKATF